MRVIRIKLDCHIKRLDITQHEFAIRTGLRPAVISKMTNNKYRRIELSHLLSIMSVLQIDSFDELLEIVDE